VAFTVSGGAAASAVKPRRIVGLLIDNSGSMNEPMGSDRRHGGSGQDGEAAVEKIVAARHAARVAIGTLPEDVEFFVIGFSHRGVVFVPRTPATPEAKRRAQDAIQKMDADGGTCISEALREARGQLRGCEGAICVVGLLTDGDNSAGDAGDLAREVKACGGLLQAHCRGFGTDWKRAKLQPISDSLMGTIGIVAKAAALEADFRSILAAAAGKTLSDLRVRLWMPKVVTLRSFKQMFPAENDITAKQTPVDQRSVDIPLGAWGTDSQDYQAVFATAPRDPDGMSTAVCRPSLVYTDTASGQETVVPAEVNYDPPPEWGEVRAGVVEASWTDNLSLTMRANKVVEHYTGESEKVAAKQEFAEAWEKGDQPTATVRLQKVMELAQKSGDEDTVRMVRQVADVDDTGTVTLRRKEQVSKADVMGIEVSGTWRAERGHERL
jgi:hypothetical protein